MNLASSREKRFDNKIDGGAEAKADQDRSVEEEYADNNGNSRSGEVEESADGPKTTAAARTLQMCGKSAAINLSAASVSGFSISGCSSFSCATTSTTSTSTMASSSSSQIRRYGMNESTDSPSPSTLKLPRTLSTSVLKVKYRSSFWEKFWEERSKRDM